MPKKKSCTRTSGRKTEPTYGYTLTLTEAAIQQFIEHLKYRIHRSTRDAVEAYEEGDLDGRLDLYVLANDVRLHDGLQRVSRHKEDSRD